MYKHKSASEYQECKAYFQWASYHTVTKDYLIKNVNEGKRSKIAGYLLTLIGLRSGLPDYHLPIANEKYHGLWIEMKLKGTERHKKNQLQEEWLEKLRKIGHYTSYAYGWEDAVSITLAYLKNAL